MASLILKRNALALEPKPAREVGYAKDNIHKLLAELEAGC